MKLVQERYGRKRGKVGMTCTIRDRATNKTKSFTIHGYELDEAYNSAYFHFLHECRVHQIKYGGVDNGKKETDGRGETSLRAINTAT